MLKLSWKRLQGFQPELHRYSQSTFHDGTHRQAPGDSTPWKDASSPISRLRAWWLAPAAKGSVMGAWGIAIIMGIYCVSLQQDAKRTYLLNSVILRNLHEQTLRADVNNEKSEELARVLKGLYKEGKLRGTKGLGVEGLEGTTANEEAMRGKSALDYETELCKVRARSELLHERNQKLLNELSHERSLNAKLEKEKKIYSKSSLSTNAEVMLLGCGCKEEKRNSKRIELTMIPHEYDMNGGFNDFVGALYDCSERPPWTKRYEPRRWLSKEERIIRQVGLELSWANRPVETLWKQLRPFALPSKDYKISDKDFLDFLTVSGISPLIRQRIFSLMKEQSGGSVDAMLFCKAIDMALEDPTTSDQILLHCFRSLPLSADREEHVLLEDALLRVLSTYDGKKSKSLKKRHAKLSSREFLIRVRKQQLNGVKELFSDERKILDFPTFREVFLTDGGKLASVFIKQIIEACAKYFWEPFGRFPAIPLRWINTMTPLPFGEVPADADSLLLQDVEFSGVDPNLRKRRHHKKKKKIKESKRYFWVELIGKYSPADAVIMEAVQEIQMWARVHRYHLDPFALKKFSDFLSGVPFVHPDDRRNLMQDIFLVLKRIATKDRTIDAEKVETAIQLQIERIRGATTKAEKHSLRVVPLVDVPRVTVDELTEEIRVAVPSLSASVMHRGRQEAFRHRYLMARRRCWRSALYRKGTTKRSNVEPDNDVRLLLPSSTLEGIDSNKVISVLGLLVHRDGAYSLEDLRGVVPVVIEEHTQLNYRNFCGAGFMVVVTGTWAGGQLHASQIDLPPAEKRQATLKDAGPSTDLFGLLPSNFEAALEKEKKAVQAVGVFLANIYLDKPATLQQLAKFFSTMQQRGEEELADTTFVLIGDFCSTPMTCGDASHLDTEPQNSGQGKLHLLLETLGSCISANAPTVAQQSQFIIIPGPNDNTALNGVLPQPPLPTSFASGLAKKVKRLSLGPNPCRLRFLTQEIVVSRRDYLRCFQRSERVCWPEKYGHKRERDNEETPVDHFERVTRTVLGEAHLCPDLVEGGVLWKMDDSLSLPVLPHTLLLCDTVEPWECIYMESHVVNPGSFSASGVFLCLVSRLQCADGFLLYYHVSHYTLLEQLDQMTHFLSCIQAGVPEGISGEMKRSRSGYSDPNDVRLKKVNEFISSLKFSVPLYRVHEQRERRSCPKCGKKRLYYCYDCLSVTHPECHPAPVKLPLNVYVLFHPGELRSKSTSLAASTISPDLHIIDYPEVPATLDPESTLLLYPSAESVEIHEIDNLEQYKNVVFVESTWQKSKGIARDERVLKFKHVRIPSQTTLFWRFQNNDPSHLATVEAIYYFLRTFVAHKARSLDPAAKANTVEDEAALLTKYYHGEVDDLLLYYIHQFIAVQQRYGDEGRYTDRHFEGYILKGGAWDSFLSLPHPIRYQKPKHRVKKTTTEIYGTLQSEAKSATTRLSIHYRQSDLTLKKQTTKTPC
eukprot:gene5248-3759_t